MPEITAHPSPAHIRQGSSIGQPLTRRDGILKVTGGARYAADNHPSGMLHAVLAVSRIARGRVTHLDIQAARAHPGVVEVMTPANKPPLAEDPDAKTNPFMFRLDLLQNDRVRYAHQPIAVVIAETLEAATEGAALLAPRYETEPARVGLDGGESFVPPAVGVGNPSEVHRGDVEAGLVAASKRIDAIYETPAQYHNAMEPHAIVAVWNGDALSIDTPTQGLVMAQGRIAGLFGIPPENIHIRSPFLGGGFGSKGLIAGPQILGIMAARLVGRPVKLVLRRDDAGLLVGWGVGTATFPALMFQARARAVIRADGTGVMETGAHDMGQGAWTAFAQIAADGMGLELERIEFRAGTSDLPDAGIAGGSAHTATAGMAIHNAGADVIAKLAALATGDERSPLFGAGNAGVIARGGRLFRRDDESRSESYADILARAGTVEIEGHGSSAMDPASQSAYAMHAHGAVFAEVKVDPDLGQIRATRLVDAFAAGRIVNPRLVRSQYYGGMIWGVSFALHERAVMDPRSGRPMNPNLAEYHVPVNADVPSLEAILVEERDPHVNALGIKGVGEIGITGTAGAIANAVWHATGIRVRQFPITLERLFGGTS